MYLHIVKTERSQSFPIMWDIIVKGLQGGDLFKVQPQ